jgi:large subunit ribosomal protein L3
MALKLMGKKRGMTQLFDEQGNVVVCTVIEIEPHVVTQVKTKATDGYTAIQLGFEKVKTKDPRTVKRRVKHPRFGHFQKSGVEPRRYLAESRLDSVEEYAAGQEVGLEVFTDVTHVDITGQSKGKGYQWVMKLHNFAGGPAAHGSSFHRHAGSTGHRSTPGRSFPDSPRASHMGDDRVTTQNLKVIKIDQETNTIVVKGAVPGTRNGLVFLSAATKMN